MDKNSHLKVVHMNANKPKKKFRLNRFMDYSEALSIKPILPNALALCIGFFMLYVLSVPNLLPNMSHWVHTALTWSVYLLLFYQVICSALKSIILPLLLVAIAGLGFIVLSQHLGKTWIDPAWLKAAMLVGIMGLFAFAIEIR